MNFLRRALLIGVIFLSACNLPAVNGAGAISTSAALTVSAELSAVPQASATAQATSAITITPTYAEPLISVEGVTNCRTGPGTNYERVTQISPNEQVKVIGAYIPGYWIVSTSAGVCWISQEFATPSGSMSALPTVTAPATPTGNAPEGLSLQKWYISCNYSTNQANVTISWTDEDNETGYRVIRNGTDAIELAQNATQFAETITLLGGQSVGYEVEAYNGVGSTKSRAIVLYC
ncbi:MAG: SH3 domain-containing protein [Anaerolineales bacterium]|nr:SH3 domain-containing protein [Anaerolineales bacterium]MCZ2122336.1 SH3 domain-containing protein [Anaerolineales bacterium]